MFQKLNRFLQTKPGREGAQHSFVLMRPAENYDLERFVEFQYQDGQVVASTADDKTSLLFQVCDSIVTEFYFENDVKLGMNYFQTQVHYRETLPRLLEEMIDAAMVSENSDMFSERSNHLRRRLGDDAFGQACVMLQDEGYDSVQIEYSEGFRYEHNGQHVVNQGLFSLTVHKGNRIFVFHETGPVEKE